MQTAQTLTFGDWAYLAPELTLVVAALLLALLDLFLPRSASRSGIGWLTLVAIAVSITFVVIRMLDMNPGDGTTAQAIDLLGQSYRIDDFANLMKLIFLVGTGLVIFMSIGSVNASEIPHEGEYYYLYLPAVLGAMMMASSGDLITLYVGLELLSITTYVLVGMRKHKIESTEGAFKYVVMGGVSSAFILYGMSFLYGLSGTTNVAEIGSALAANLDGVKPLLYVSFFLMLAGFGFKIAAAPFHTWAPDVYQGAPTPVTGFLAVVSKGAGFALVFRLIYSIYWQLGDADVPMHTDVFLALKVLAAIAMIVGTTMALKQKNVKRLLALSGVANAGYLLVPLAVQLGGVHSSNFSEFTFYLIAYLFMNIGAFAVLMIVSRASGHDELKGYAGLYYRAPMTAVGMVILLLSLAGLPVTGGFMGKLFIILGAAQSHDYWLAGVMVASSVVSYYFYFGVIRQMFMRSQGEESEIRIAKPLGITVWLCVIVTLVLGFFPNMLLDYINSIFSLGGDFFIR